MATSTSVNIFQGAIVTLGLTGFFGFNQDMTGAQIIQNAGDPNAVVTAPQGSIVLDITGPFVWQNTDSATAWAKVGLQV